MEKHYDIQPVYITVALLTELQGQAMAEILVHGSINEHVQIKCKYK